MRPALTRTKLTVALTFLALTMTGVAVAAARTTGTKTQTASAQLSGGAQVTAKLTYQHKSFWDKSMHLTITRAGKQLYSAPLSARQCGKYCIVSPPQALYARDLQANGEPDVTVGFYTGGAHCCTVTQFFSYVPATHSYRKYSFDWGDYGYALHRWDGQDVFQTNNDLFAYAFTDYAGSGAPLLLYSFDGTKLVDVTLQYPKRIAADAARWLKAYQQTGRYHWVDSVGVIAAWAADEDELGNQAVVSNYLHAQAAAGHLNSGRPGMASGGLFVAKLTAFLRETGYLS